MASVVGRYGGGRYGGGRSAGGGGPAGVWGPSPGTIEHPIARMNTILRQVEAPVKIYKSGGSNHQFKLSGIGL